MNESRNWVRLFLVSIFLSIIYHCGYADGTRDMYPSDYFTKFGLTHDASNNGANTGDYRAVFYTYVSSATNIQPFPTTGTMKVYAKPTEHIYLASSIFSRSGGHIDWKAPDGTSGTFTKNGNVGYIQNRAQELAGPKLPNGKCLDGTTNGYTACIVDVKAGQEGVWEINFGVTGATRNYYGYFENSTKLPYKIDDWVEATDAGLSTSDGSSTDASAKGQMAAFDISVVDASGTYIPGRVYSNVFNYGMNTRCNEANPGVAWSTGWYTNFYVLTNTGYLYLVNPNGATGGSATFLSNSSGVRTSDNKPTYSSEKGTSPNLKDPRTPDDATGVTNKLFFCKPAEDMPDSAMCVYGYSNQIVETWLLSKENAKDSPQLSKLCVAGRESHIPFALGPEGLEVYFESNSVGEYIITLSFSDGFITREFTGTAAVGVNTIDWDGKDGAGNDVGEATITLEGALKTAEVHFPYIDMDNNKNGIILQQLKTDWTTVQRQNVFWDDSNISTQIYTEDDPVKSPDDGKDSPAHKYSISSTIGNNNGIGYGNTIDTWSYAKGTASGIQVCAVKAKYLDLAIKSITCDKRTAKIGELVTYTLEVENVYHDNYEFNGLNVKVDADADSASVGVWFPNGGFYTTEVKLVSTDDEGYTQVIQQPSGDEYGLGYISLRNGKKATVTVTGYAGPKLAHKEILSQGFIMRPGDYFEIDANNLTDDGVPLIPYIKGELTGEYYGISNNNLLDAPDVLFFLNSAPIAEDENVSIASCLDTTVNLFANDSDVDGDAMAVTKYYLTKGTDITPGTKTALQEDGATYAYVTINADGTCLYEGTEWNGNTPKIYYVVSDQFEGVSETWYKQYEDIDLRPGIDTASIQFVISPNNQPTVSVASLTTIDYDTKVEIPFSIADSDGDDCTVTLSGTGSTYFTYTGGKLYYNYDGSATLTSTTTYALTATVNDNCSDPVTKSFSVKVEKNNAPEISPTNVSITVKSKKEDNYVNVPVVFSDPDGDAITITITGGKDQGSFRIKDGVLQFNVKDVKKGDKKVNVTVTDSKGASTTKTITVTVNTTNDDQKTVNLSVGNASVVYGTKLSDITLTKTAKDGWSTITGTWTIQNYNEYAVLPVDTYTVRYLFTPNDLSKYQIGTTTATIIITPKVITVESIVADDKEYDGTTTANISTINYEGRLATEDASIVDVNVVSANFSDANVGTDKTVTATYELIGGGISNYTLASTTGSTTADITAKEVGLSWNPITFEYDGSDKTVTATVTGLVGSDDCTVSSYTNNVKSEAGSYTATATALSNSNYQLPATTSQDWKITPKELTPSELTIEIESGTYTYDGLAKTPTVTVKDKVTNTVIPASEYTVSYSNNINAGTATITITDNANGNYTIAKTTKTFEIGKATITVSSVSASDKVYDGTETASVGVEFSGVQNYENTDIINVSATGTFNDENVGAGKTVTTSYALTGTGAANYQLASTSGSTTASITAKPLTLTWSTTTSFDYDGSEKSINVTMDGVLTGDNCSAVTSGMSATNAGSYTGSVTGLSGADKDNYSLPSNTTQAWTIQKSTVEQNITIEGDSLTVTYNGSEQSVTGFTHSKSDDATYTVALKTGSSAVAKGTNAGTYKMGLTEDDFEVSSTNYSNIKVTVKDGYLTINKKTLTITGTTVDNKTYDGTKVATVSTTGATLNGVETGDAVTVSAEGTFDTKNVGTNKDVTVVYKLDGEDAKNYTIDNETLQANVTTKTITISGTKVADKTYDGTTDMAVTPGTLDKVESGDVVSVSSATGTLVDDANAGNDKDVTVKYTLTGADAANYTLADQIIQADVNKKEVTLTWTTQTTFEYDGSDKTVTVKEVTGLIGSDACEVTSYTNNSNSEVGDYVAEATALSNSNYKLPATPTQAWTIEKSTVAQIVTITGNNLTVTYNGTEQSVSGFTHDKSSDASYTVSLKSGSKAEAKGTNVGTYKMGLTSANFEVSSTHYSNITVNVTDGLLTIKPKTIAPTDLKIEVASGTYTYDGTEKKPAVTVKDGETVIPDSVYTVTYSNNTNAGTATITITDNAIGNYRFADTTKNFTITPREVTLTSATDSKMYDGTPLTNSTVSVSGDGFATSEGASYSVTGTQTEVGASKNAFTYTLDSKTLAGNYNITKVEGDLEVTKSTVAQTVTIEGKNLITTYNGTEQSVSGFTHDKSSDASYTVSLKSGSKAEAKGTNAGTYKMGLTAANFEVSSTHYSNITVNVTDGLLTIKPKTIDPMDLKIEVASGTYTYDGTEKKPGVTVKDSETVIPDSVYTVTYSNNINAGTATITITDNAIGNYRFAETTKTFEIGKATITVDAVSANDKVYDGTKTAVVKPTFSGVKNSESTSVINVAAIGEFDDENVGTDKTVTTTYELTGSGASNYQLASTTGSTTANITAKEVGLTWTTPTTFEYDGSNKTVTVTKVNDLIGSDACEVTSYTNNSNSEVGDYVAEATALSNSNYKLSATPTQAWKIEKSTIAQTITIEGDSLTVTYNGSEQSVTGFTHNKSDDATYTVALKAGSSAVAKGTNAGTYIMGLTEENFEVSSTNYSNIKVTVKDGYLTIKKKTLTITGTTVDNKTYDGTTATTTTAGSLVGVESGDNVTVSAKGTLDNKNAGANKNVTIVYTLDGTSKDNYTIDDETKTITVSPKQLTVSGTLVDDKTYDGTLATTTTAGTLSGVVEGEVVTVDATGTLDDANAEENKPVNVSYTISGADAANYTAPTSATSITNVAKVAITLTSATASFVYDGTYHSKEEVKVTSGSMVGTEEFTFGGFATIQAVGTVENTFTITDNTALQSNYDINVVKGTLTVTSISTTATAELEYTTIVYDGNDKKPSVVVKDNNNVVIPSEEYEVEYTSNHDAGTATVTIKPKVGSSYDFDPIIKTFEITPKKLTVTGTTVANKTYDGTTATTTTVGSLVDVEKGDKVTVSAEGTFDNKNVGTDKNVTVVYTLSGDDAKNYTIENETLKADVTTKTITISGTTVADKTYDGTTDMAVTLGTLKDTVKTDNIAVSATGTLVDNANAGNNKDVTVKYTLTGTDAANYTLADETIKANVNKKVLTLDWKSPTSFVYDGSSKSIGVTIKGILAGDDLSAETTGLSATNVGSYTGAVTALSGADKDNYSLPSNTTQDWTITAKDLTVADFIQKDTTFSYDGTAHSAIITPSIGITDSDYKVYYKVDGNWVETAPTNAGTYEVKISVIGSNYVNEDLTGYSVTINKAKITVNSAEIAAKDYDKTVGATVSKVNFTGVQNSESTSVINVTATGKFADVNAGTNKNVTVTYSLEGTGANNYELVSTTGTATGTINPKEVTLTWNNPTTFEYDGSDKTVTVKEVTGIIGSDACEVTSYTNNSNSEVGDYVAEATALSNSNYKLPATSTQAWKIEKSTVAQAITIEGDSLTVTYNGSEQSVTGFSHNKSDDATYTVALKSGSSAVAKGTNAGTYKMGLTEEDFEVSSTNYSNIKVTVKDGYLTINKKTLTITGTTVDNKTYDGTTKATVNIGTVDGKETGDDLTIVPVGTLDTKNVGTNKNVTVVYTLSGDDAKNYTIANETLKADVTTKTISIDGTTVADKTYDGTTDMAVTLGTLKDTVKTDNIAVSATGTLANANAGNDKDVTVKYTLTGTDAANYTLADEIISANVNKKEVTLTWSTPTSFVYDGSDKSVTATIGNLVDPDACTATTINNEKKDAGSYTAEVTALSNSNYTLPSETKKSWTITPKDLANADFTQGANVFTYNGKGQGTTFTPSTGITDSDYKVYYKVGENWVDTVPVNAGTYEVKISVIGSNYENEDITGYSITINKAQITVSSVVVDAKDYDKTTDATVSKVNFTGVQNSELTSVINVTATGEFADVNAGTNKNVNVTYSLEGTGANNYELVSTTGTATGTINPKEVTLDWGTVNFTYDGDPKIVKAKVEGLIDDDVCTVTDYVNNTNSLAGNYKATATALSNSNYKLPSDATTNWSIGKLDLDKADFIQGDSIFTYNGKGQGTTFTTDSSIKEGTDYVVYYKIGDEWTTDKPVDAGTYEVKIKVIGDDYVNEDITGYTETINKKTLTITGTTVDNKTYDGTTKATVNIGTVDGKEAGDDLTIVPVGTLDTKNVGANKEVIVVYTLGGKDSINYTISNDALTTNVSPKLVTVTGTTVDDKTYDGTTDMTVNIGSLKDTVSTDDVTITAATGTLLDANAGTNKIVSISYTLSGDDAANYSLNNDSKSANVTKKEVTLDWGETALTYNGSEQKVEAIVKGVVTGDEVNVQSFVDNKKTNVGDYTATAKGLDNSNYCMPADSTVAWTISPKSVTPVLSDSIVVDPETGDSMYVDPVSGDTLPVTPANYIVKIIPSSDSLIYNGEEQKPAVEIYINGTKVDTTEYKVTYTDNTNAGEATITITDKDGGNYTIEDDEEKFTIYPKEVILNWGETALTYNGSEQKVEATVEGVLTGDEVNVTSYADNKKTNVGDYTATAKGLDNSNYCMPADSTVAWTISPKSVTPVLSDSIVVDPETGDSMYVDPVSGDTLPVTPANYIVKIIPSSDSLIYNGEEQKPEVEIYINGTKVDPSEYEVTYTDNTNAGEATITITDKDGGNYTIGDDEEKFTIYPKEVILNWGETALTYNGSEQKVEATVEGVLTGDEVNVTSYADNKKTNVGDYTATAKGLDNSNYCMPADSTVAWTISPKSVTPVLSDSIVVDPETGDSMYVDPTSGDTLPFDSDNNYIVKIIPASDSLIYNGEEQKPAVEIYINGTKVDPSEYEVTYTDNTNAGESTITITDKDGGNYTIGDDEEKFTIYPKEVILDWGETALTYNGSEQKVEAIVEGVLTGDEVNVTSYADNKKTNVGDYTATAKGLDNSNYCMPADSTVAWAISPKSVTPVLSDSIVVDPETGDSMYVDPVSGDTLPVTPANYIVKIIPSSDSLIYNGEEQKPAVEIYINGTKVDTTEYKVTYTDNTNAGEATITITDKDGGNYTIGDDEEKFTIYSKEVILNWGETALTYNGSEQKVEATVEGVVTGDEVNVTSYADNNKTNVGDYTATAKGLDNSNYCMPADSTVAWTISPKSVTPVLSDSIVVDPETGDSLYVDPVSGDTLPVTPANYIVKIIPSSDSLIYNGEEQKPEVEIYIDGTKVDPREYEVTYTDNTNAGEATITITDKEGGNYTIEDDVEKFVIYPKEVTLDWGTTDLTYNGSEQKVEATVEGVLTGDEVNVQSYVDNKKTNVGDYTATAKGLDNSNYCMPADSTVAWTISPKSVTPVLSDSIVVDPETGDSLYVDPVSGDTLPVTPANYIVKIIPASDSLIYNGEEQKPEVEIYIDGTKVDPSEYEVTYTDNTNAGESTITITDKEGGNYTIEDDVEKFVIYPKEVILDWGTTDLTYNGSEQKVEATVKGVLTGDEVNVQSYVDNKKTNVGDYTATAKGLDNSNYCMPADSTVAWTISPKSVTPVLSDSIVVDPETGDSLYVDPVSGDTLPVTPANYIVKIIPASDSLIYNGEEQKPEVEIYIDGTKVDPSEYEVTYTDNTNAGESTITITDKEGGNYTIEDDVEKFVIYPKEVILDWGTTDLTYNGSEQKVEATVEGVVTGDEVNVQSYVDNKKTNVGDYTATAKGLDNSNYCMPADSTVAWTISPKSVTPVSEDSIFVDPETGDSMYVDPVSGDTLPVNPVNYIVKIIPASDSLIYNGEEQKPEVEIYIDGTKVDPSEYEVTYTDNTNAGESTITITDKEGGNYTIEDDVEKFVIYPKEIELIWTDDSITFDGSEKSVTAEVAGAIEGDEVAVKTYEDNKATEVGAYTAVAKELDNSNYKLPEDASYDWSIVPMEDFYITVVDGEDTLEVLTVHKGDVITVEDLEDIVPEKEGYDFAGWEPELPYIVGQKDTTISAKYVVKTYTIKSFNIANDGYCPETEDVISFTKEGTGCPVAFRLIFDEKAIEAGFENTEYAAIAGNELPISIPYCDAGSYKVQVQFRNIDNSETEKYDVVLNTNLSNRYLIDIWSDVVSAVNVENRFLEYQWYHNDEKLDGATAPYYCEMDGLTGNYYMEVLTVDNRRLRTCKKYFGDTKENISLLAYPNPTKGEVTVWLSFDNGEEHSLTVVNANGVNVLTTSFKGQKTTIDFTDLPQGGYVINVDGLNVKEIKK